MTDDRTGVTLELERLRGAVDSGFARLDGRLAALERTRWPLPSLAILTGAAGCALSAWQLLR